MKLIRMITLTLLFIASAFNSYGQQKIDDKTHIDGIAAIINEEIILYSEVTTAALRQAFAQGINILEDKEKYNEYLKSALNSLIVITVQVAIAEEDTTIVVTEEEVESFIDQQIQAQIQQFGSQEALENAFGGTIASLKELYTKNAEARNNLLIQKLQQKIFMDITPTRSEVKSFYETYKDSIAPVPRVYDISHILRIPSRPPEVVAAKKALMDSLLQLIHDGADFAELAKRHSDDTFSAVNGGDLGWLEPGDLVPEFDSAIAALDSGEVSGIVITQIGLHIIQLLERDGERFHARHILALLRLTEEDHQRAVNDLKSYRERALHEEDFGELAVKYSDDADVQTHKGSLGEWDLERLPQLLQEFKPHIENLKEGEISEPFSTQFGYHIVKVNKLTENRLRTLEEDYDYLREIATNNKQIEYYQKWLAEKKKEMYIEIKMTFNDTTGTVKKH